MVAAKLELGQHRENLASWLQLLLTRFGPSSGYSAVHFGVFWGGTWTVGGFATAGKVGSLGHRTRNLRGPVGGGCPGALARHRQPQTLANGRNNSLRQSFGSLNAAV